MGETLDCLIVGGGPAGLTAAVYLGRFRRRVRVIDDGHSRAGWIPRTRNLSGFPDGVEGPELLERMRAHARRYGAEITPGRVDALAPDPAGGFSANADDWAMHAPFVLLATGVVEQEPALPHCNDAIRRGLIRICPICDGFETIGKRVAVLGADAHAAREALFLRAYSADVAVILVGDPSPLRPDLRDDLARAGVEVIETAMDAVRLEDGLVAVRTGEGEPRSFDTVYSAFGTSPENGLAQALGAGVGEDGRLLVDAHQQTSIPGLYAAGDLVRSLNQIAVAEGEAAVAATAIHNLLPRRLA